MGINDDAAFSSAERDIDHRAFPGHPTGQGADFVEIDVWRVTQTAFGRATGDRMLHPESGKDFQAAIVHGYRYMDDDFAAGIPQNLPQTFV